MDSSIEQQQIDLSVLKTLSLTIQTSYQNERKNLFEELNNVLIFSKLLNETNEVTILKGVFKTLLLTLDRYNNKKSRNLVINLIDKLLKKYSNSSKYLINCLFNYLIELKPIGLFASRKCLTILKWLCLLNSKNLNQLDKDHKQQLLKCHSIIISIISEINYHNHYYLLKQYLNKFIDYHFSIEQYLKELVDLNIDNDNSVFIFNLWEFMFEKINFSKTNLELIKLNKQYPIDLLTKFIICSKIKIPNYKFYRFSNLVIQNIDNNLFKNEILPAIQKSVLRSAETALPVIDYIIQNLKIDLSEFVELISKLITSQLYGKEDLLRELSINCFKNLAIKSNKKESIELMIKNLTNIYNGSDGKLSLPAQKSGVLCALGSLSESKIIDDSLIEIVCLNLISFMKNEIHEPTLIECLNHTAKWSSKLNSKLSAKFLEQIKSVFTIKSVTPMVKAINYLVLKSSVNQNNLDQFKEFQDIVNSSITIGLKSNISQHQLISELLFASTFVLKLNLLDNSNTLNDLIQSLIKLDKLLFLNEKYLTVCSIECYYEILEFIRLIFKSNLDNKLDHNELSILFTSFVNLLNFKSNHQIRSKAKELFKEIFVELTDKNSKHIKLILNCFLKLYSPLKLDDLTADNLPSSNSLVEFIKIISSIKQPIDHKIDDFSALSIEYNYLLDLFIPCHIPVVYLTRNQLWLKLLNKYLSEVNVQLFIEFNLNNLVNLAYNDQENIRIQENCIKTLVNYYPDSFLPVLIRNISNCLQNVELNKISKIEYEIFKTPDDELYDLSVIDSNAEQFNTKNIKKESKLYSYQDQLDEIKFRQELLAKKKNVELNKKQQEAKKIQLEKESEIRKRVAKLNSEFEISILRLNIIIDGNPLFTSFYLKDIIPLLVNLFKSHLCAEKSIKTFLNLSKCVKDKRTTINYLVKSISYAILRQFEPYSEIDSNWTVFNLEDVETNLLNDLYNLILSPNNILLTLNDDDDDDVNNEPQLSLDDQSKVLKPTTFTYIFPFISNLLVKQNKLDNTFDKLLNLISKHVTLEFNDEINELEDLAKNPIYLPRKDLCELLLDIIEKKSIMIANKANKVFLQLSKCIAHYPDNDDHTLDDIYTIVLDKLNSKSDLIRNACLDHLNDQLEHLLDRQDNKKLFNKLIKSIWIEQFDYNKECELKATEFWVNYKIVITPELCDLILEDIQLYKYELLETVSDSIAEILREYNDKSRFVFDKLSMIYKEIAPESIPSVDEFGRPLNRRIEDNFVPRLAIALILTKSAIYMPDDILKAIADFLVNLALRDINDQVAKQMLAFGIALINKTSKENLHGLLKIFQQFLEQTDNSKETDKIRASVVVLTGTLASRLDKTDPYIKQIIVKLIETLSTPSQMVQESVAFCLPSLVPSIKEEIPTLIENLFKLLLESDNYGEKKGAAYGIAGFVKGLGILSIKELGIIDKCKKAINHKKTSRKLGALIAYEVFCSVLGKLFEPYIIKLIPNLFICFGDTNENVRRVTNETSKVIMNTLTSYGVKFILPSLLRALKQDNWRTKVGSVELLGAMAYCSPQSLSQALPTIVPCLMGLVCDSHIQVQKAANDALKQIGNVIKNPEVQEIVPILLNALDDPANKTQKCLDTMLTTRFIHFIDAPSLALIMPVIERAFEARSTKTRKSAAQIMGNLYSLTDQKDLKPYLSAVIPGLKQSLLDPVPDVRSSTARALGMMIRGVSDNMIHEIMPWLQKTLVSESNSVDRSGAAQGLSEVIGGLGLDKLHQLMPEIIKTTERNDVSPYVKDGYLMLYIYLPLVFGQEFTPYIGKITHPILKALADENEFVRETAFKAGQRIVNLYANTAIQLLLPELEEGLFHVNWRIRYSSVQLLGDLLFKISGVSGKMTTETAGDDDNFGTEKSFKAILTALGEERRNRVLSGLYMSRLDVSLSVRQASLHVWKVIVSNTPRTLKEIMGTLFTILLSSLASKHYDLQQVSARTLGDLVKKLGQRILPQIMPILEKGLESDRADERQGVCIGLSEIMASTSKEMVESFVESLVPTITKALYDPLPEVRLAASKTFDKLFDKVGNKALDEIIPSLLIRLDDPVVGDYVLDGLKQILTVKSNAVLPYLIPQLTVTPINIRALSFLSCVAGDSLSKHLLKILPALLNVLTISLDTEEEKQNSTYCKKILLSITDDQGCRTIIEYLFGTAKSEDRKKSLSSIMMLNMYCQNTTANLTIYMSILIRGLIHLFIIDDEKILINAWEAFTAITKLLDSKQLIELIPDLQTAVKFSYSDYKALIRKTNLKLYKEYEEDNKPLLLPGFCIQPKGIAPFLPYFKDALSMGNPDQKELASNCLIEILKITSNDGLKSSVIILSGALIRSLGDTRSSQSLKISVIETLTLMLEKVGTLMKQFMPQLTQSFLKLLVDQNRTVRIKSANAISYLIQVHQKCDIVINELHQQINQPSEDNLIKETMIFAIRVCLIQAGDKFSPQIKTAIMKTILNNLDTPDESYRIGLAACLGSLCKWLTANDFEQITKNYLLELSPTEELNHSRSISLRICLKESPERLLNKQEWNDKLIKILSSHITSDKVFITINGIKGAAYYFLYNLIKDQEISTQLITTFSKCMNHSNNSIKTCVATSSSFIAKNYNPKTLPLSMLKILVPLLVNGCSDSKIVKSNSEQALITILKLRESDEIINDLLSKIDAGPKSSLETCLNKTLRRVASSIDQTIEEPFDETLLV